MASTPSAPPAIPPVASLTAPYIFGSLFNWALFGVLSVQVYIYARSFSNDKLWMKGLVYFIFVIEIVQTSLNGYDLYQWFAPGFGDIPGLAKVNLSPIDIPLFAAVVSFAVQLFFCYRIFGIKRSFWPICIFIGLIALTQATAALYGASTALMQGSIAEAEVNKRIVIVWLVNTSVADVMIAGIMTFLLLRARQAEHQYSSDVLTKIVRLTVETNSVTAAMAIITLAIFLGFPNTGYFYTPSVVVGKLYSNTLLVSLNNRILLRQAATRVPKSLRSGRTDNSLPLVASASPRGQFSFGSSSSNTEDEATKVQSIGTTSAPGEKTTFIMDITPENAV